MGALQTQGRQRAFPLLKASQGRIKAHLAAVGNDILPHGLHHLDQLVRADVGLGLDADIRRRAVFDQQPQHLMRPGILDAGGQLAIGKSTGAAFAKHHVAIGVKRPAVKEAGH